MTRTPIPIEEAEEYLLGRLEGAARRRFETRLAQDPALRQLVRELEEGALALALSAPQLRPPREAWTNIQAALTRKSQFEFLGPLLSLHWLSKSWHVAGGVAVAVCLHLAAVHISGLGQKPDQPHWTGQPAETIALVAQPEQTPPTARRNSNPVGSVVAAPELPVGSSAFSRPGIFASAGNVACRENEAAVAPAQALNSSHRRLPHGQRTASVAEARQAGTTNSPNAPVPMVAAAQMPVQVDYVKFSNPVTPASSGVVNLDVGSGLMESTLDPSCAFDGADAHISLFASGDDLIINLDPALLPANLGPLTICMADAAGDVTVVGTVAPGVNPMVIAIQGADLDGSYEYMVIAGSTNVLGCFPP